MPIDTTQYATVADLKLIYPYVEPDVPESGDPGWDDSVLEMALCLSRPFIDRRSFTYRTLPAHVEAAMHWLACTRPDAESILPPDVLNGPVSALTAGSISASFATRTVPEDDLWATTKYGENFMRYCVTVMSYPEAVS